MADGAEEHSEPASKSETPTRAIALLALASFASAANLRVCDPLLPQIAGELGVTVGTAALTVMAFALAYGVFQVVVGPLGDARGKLKHGRAGLAVGRHRHVVSAAMQSLEPLAVMRFLAGAGGARRSSRWRSPGSATSCPTSDARPCWRATSRGRSWASCSARRRAASLGDLIGWRATLVVLGVVHIVAGLLLLGEMRRLEVGMSAPGRVRWRQSRGVRLSRAARRLGAHCADQRVPRGRGHVRRPRLRRRASCTSASA